MLGLWNAPFIRAISNLSFTYYSLTTLHWFIFAFIFPLCKQNNFDELVTFTNYYYTWKIILNLFKLASTWCKGVTAINQVHLNQRVPYFWSHKYIKMHHESEKQKVKWSLVTRSVGWNYLSILVWSQIPKLGCIRGSHNQLVVRLIGSKVGLCKWSCILIKFKLKGRNFNISNQCRL